MKSCLTLSLMMTSSQNGLVASEQRTRLPTTAFTPILADRFGCSRAPRALLNNDFNPNLVDMFGCLRTPSTDPTTIFTPQCWLTGLVASEHRSNLTTTTLTQSWLQRVRLLQDVVITAQPHNFTPCYDVFMKANLRAKSDASDSRSDKPCRDRSFFKRQQNEHALMMLPLGSLCCQAFRNVSASTILEVEHNNLSMVNWVLVAP